MLALRRSAAGLARLSTVLPRLSPEAIQQGMQDLNAEMDALFGGTPHAGRGGRADDDWREAATRANEALLHDQMRLRDANPSTAEGASRPRQVEVEAGARVVHVYYGPVVQHFHCRCGASAGDPTKLSTKSS